MTERDDYYGFNAQPRHRLINGTLVPIPQAKADELPPKPSEPEQLPLLNEIREARSTFQKTVENPNEELTEEVLGHIYAGDFRKAYGLACNEGADISGHKGLFAVLEDEMREIFVEGSRKPTERYIKLFYLLGENADLDVLPGLKDFIKMVFDHYYEKCWPLSSPKPLIKLIKLFGRQIDFGYTIQELKEEEEDYNW